MSYAPPQGFLGQPPTSEQIIAEVLSVAYSANDSIFGASLTPDIPAGSTVEWTVYFSFDGSQAVIEYSLDGGTTWTIVQEDITPSVSYAPKVVVASGDQVQFRFSKNGTIIYCRVGQPV
jgi:hypothetical protein